MGVIQGGTVANAVPASCEVNIDIRYDSLERLEETLQAIRKIAETNTVPDTTAEMTWTKPSTVMPVSEENLKLFRHVQEAADLIGYGTLTTKKGRRMVRFLSGSSGRCSGRVCYGSKGRE